MKTVCVMATAERLAEGLCQGEITEKRAWRGSHFCSNECHREYRRQRRNWRAQRACRLCGHRLPKKKQAAALRSEHTAAPETLQPEVMALA